MKKRNDTIDSLRAIINAKEEAMKLQIAETDNMRRENRRLRRIIKKLKEEQISAKAKCANSECVLRSITGCCRLSQHCDAFLPLHAPVTCNL